MITNTMAVDYATLTTFSTEAYEIMVSLVRAVVPNPNMRTSAVMQYKGFTLSGDEGSAFVGRSFVAHKQHFMVRVSSKLADDFIRAIMYLDDNPKASLRGTVKCTRLDTQLTLPSVGGDAAVNDMLYDRLYNNLQQLRTGEAGKPKKATMFKSSEGDNTIYVGSRVSEKMLRIYEKTTEDGNSFTRVEAEIKGKVSAGAFDMLLDTTSEGDYQLLLVSTMKNMVEQLPRDGLIRRHTLFLSMFSALDLPKRVIVKETDKGKWILEVCLPALYNWLVSKSSLTGTELFHLEAVSNLLQATVKRERRFESMDVDDYNPYQLKMTLAEELCD